MPTAFSYAGDDASGPFLHLLTTTASSIHLSRDTYSPLNPQKRMPIGASVTSRLIRHTRTRSLQNAVIPSTPLGARGLCMPPGKLCRSQLVDSAASATPQEDDAQLEELLKATLPPPSEGDDLTPEAALAELRKISRAKPPAMPSIPLPAQTSLGGKAAKLFH